MLSDNLPNKPLVEAIFELKWALSSETDRGFGADPNYPLLVGRISERLEKLGYEFHEPLPASQIPDQIFAVIAHIPQHRFRVAKDMWPLVQIGPGLVTLNETEGYGWESFRPRCNDAVQAFIEAHPGSVAPKVLGLTLRFINAVDVDFERESILHFLSEKMRIKVDLPSSLFAENGLDGNPETLNWQTTFQHKDSGLRVTLRLATGKKKDRPALVWETLLQVSGDHVPQVPDGFLPWLDDAHKIARNWFDELIKGDLERRFRSND